MKISFQGQVKSGTLKVANYNVFMQDAEGCRAITPVQYRVNVRCMGCSTSEDGDFHVFEGAQFNGKLTSGHMAVKNTYSPVEGQDLSPLGGLNSDSGVLSKSACAALLFCRAALLVCCAARHVNM